MMICSRLRKNGYLLLKVGPRPDGTPPERAYDLL